MQRPGWKCPACGDLDGSHIKGCRFSPPFDTDEDIRRYYDAQARALHTSGETSPPSQLYAQAGMAAELVYTLALWQELYEKYAEPWLSADASEFVRVGAVKHPLAYLLERTRILVDMWNERVLIGQRS